MTVLRGIGVVSSRPERAVWDAAAHVADMLSSPGDYMAERVRDVADVRDLAPADTATVDPALVAALVDRAGRPHQSHRHPGPRPRAARGRRGGRPVDLLDGQHRPVPHRRRRTASQGHHLKAGSRRCRGQRPLDASSILGLMTLGAGTARSSSSPRTASGPTLRWMHSQNCSPRTSTPTESPRLPRVLANGGRLTRRFHAILGYQGRAQ